MSLAAGSRLFRCVFAYLQAPFWVPVTLLLIAENSRLSGDLHEPHLRRTGALKICIYVSYICIHMCIYIYMYTRIYLYIYIYTTNNNSTNNNNSTINNMHIHTHIYIYIYVYIYVYTCVYGHAYTCTTKHCFNPKPSDPYALSRKPPNYQILKGQEGEPWPPVQPCPKEDIVEDF